MTAVRQEVQLRFSFKLQSHKLVTAAGDAGLQRLKQQKVESVRSGTTAASKSCVLLTRAAGVPQGGADHPKTEQEEDRLQRRIHRSSLC